MDYFSKEFNLFNFYSTLQVFQVKQSPIKCNDSLIGNYIQFQQQNNLMLFQFLENDTLRMMIALCIQIPLSYPIRSLSTYKIRYLYSLVLGTLLQVFVFRYHTIAILCFGILAFGLINVKGKGQSGFIVTLASMVVLSIYHLYGLIWKYGQNSMDGVVLLMIMVCKYSLFAYACQDGFKWKQIKNKEISTISKPNEGSIVQKKEWWIQQDVKLYQFIGYLQFLPTAVMGPPIQYSIYRNFIKKQGAFALQLPTRKPILIQTAKQLSVCLVLYVISQTVVAPQSLKHPSFLQSNSLYVFFYTCLCLTLIRFKYYSAWKIGIASIHSSGVSFNQQKNDYTAIDHCKPMLIETTPHVRQKIGNWNIMVQDWLRKCIYERVGFKNRFLRQLSVFAVSAFWHGFYTGYYFSFFLWFAQLYLQMQIFKLGGKQGSKLHKFYKKLGSFQIVLVIVSCCIFSHNATFFYLLRADLCFALMRKVFFIPQLSLVVGIVLLTVLSKRSHHKKEKIGQKSN